MVTMMKVRTVDLEAKPGLCDGITVPTITYASETWTWKAKIQDTGSGDELVYLRRGYGGRRMEGKSNESVYNRYDMSDKGRDMICGVIESVKHSTLRCDLLINTKLRFNNTRSRILFHIRTFLTCFTCIA